jgi:hypothetical protein
MKIRPLFRVSFLSTLLFAAAACFIRGQPYDDSQLRRFLTSVNNCAKPCFISIRTGSENPTQTTDALKILKTHPWVGQIENQVRLSQNDPHPTFNGDIVWEWNGSQPDIVSADQKGIIKVVRDEAELIYIPTSITMGDLWLSFGLPDRGVLFKNNNYLGFGATYVRMRFAIATGWTCPMDSWTFWHTHLTLVSPDDLYARDPLPNLKFRYRVGC